MLVPYEGEPIWLVEARRFIGQEEGRGATNNPILIAMGRALGLKDFVDSEPWCTMYVAYCLRATLPWVELPRHLMWSRAFQNWGVELTEPRLGAIMVYWRGKSPAEDLGHLGFYTGPGLVKGYSQILSGNMSDRVRIADMKDEKLVSIRWPAVRRD